MKACAQHILVKTEKECLEIKEKIAKEPTSARWPSASLPALPASASAIWGVFERGHGQVV